MAYRMKRARMKVPQTYLVNAMEVFTSSFDFFDKSIVKRSAAVSHIFKVYFSDNASGSILKLGRNILDIGKIHNLYVFLGRPKGQTAIIKE